jgi:hypothetical protein
MIDNILLRIDSFAWNRFMAAPFGSIREDIWDKVGISVSELRGRLGYL